MGKGFRSLMGQRTDGYDLAYEAARPRSSDSLFLPLTEGETYSAPPSLEPIDEALVGISPGDPGCPIPGIAGFSLPEGAMADLFIPIHFETDRYEVKGASEQKALREIADYLVDSPNTYLFIEGHCDERGAAAYNLALGARRANSVREILLEHGVRNDQLFTISYGKERPVAMGHDQTSWCENRRAQFRLYAR